MTIFPQHLLIVHGGQKKTNSLWLSRDECDHRYESFSVVEGCFRFKWLDKPSLRGIGSVGAPDNKLMDLARKKDYIVFTHDLDFGALLAASGFEASPTGKID